MNIPFINDILNNPGKYTPDQRKIATKAAIDLLNSMAVKEAGHNQQIQSDANKRCPRCLSTICVNFECRETTAPLI